MKKLKRLINDQMIAVNEYERATTRTEKLEIMETINEMENIINELRKELELD